MNVLISRKLHKDNVFSNLQVDKDLYEAVTAY